MSIDLLRVGIGLVWVLNITFIVDPSNEFFPTFHDVALSFAPTSLGGTGVADFVGAHATVFAWITAALTANLAAAFVLGVTTRFACLVGGVSSLLLLLTQWASTFAIPGGTDVGRHPLYLLIYLILFVGGAGKHVAVDHWVWLSGRHSRTVTAPAPGESDVFTTGDLPNALRQAEASRRSTRS